MTNLGLKLTVQLKTQAYIFKFSQMGEYCNLLILGCPVKKSHMKTAQDIKSLCVNILHIENILCTQELLCQ